MGHILSEPFPKFGHVEEKAYGDILRDILNLQCSVERLDTSTRKAIEKILDRLEGMATKGDVDFQKQEFMDLVRAWTKNECENLGYITEDTFVGRDLMSKEDVLRLVRERGYITEGDIGAIIAQESILQELRDGMENIGMATETYVNEQVDADIKVALNEQLNMEGSDLQKQLAPMRELLETLVKGQQDILTRLGKVEEQGSVMYGAQSLMSKKLSDIEDDMKELKAVQAVISLGNTLKRRWKVISNREVEDNPEKRTLGEPIFKAIFENFNEVPSSVNGLPTYKALGTLKLENRPNEVMSAVWTVSMEGDYLKFVTTVGSKTIEFLV